MSNDISRKCEHIYQALRSEPQIVCSKCIFNGMKIAEGL